MLGTATFYPRSIEQPFGRRSPPLPNRNHRSAPLIPPAKAFPSLTRPMMHQSLRNCNCLWSRCSADYDNKKWKSVRVLLLFARSLFVQMLVQRNLKAVPPDSPSRVSLMSPNEGETVVRVIWQCSRLRHGRVVWVELLHKRDRDACRKIRQKN